MLTTMMAFHASAFFQETLNSGNTKWLMIFVGMAAIALLGQAAVMLVLAIGAVKAQKHIAETIDEMKAKLLPVIERSQGLMTEMSGLSADLSPKIKHIASKVETISGHAEEISAMLKEKVAEFGPTISAANETILQANETVREANYKTQEQVTRVNGMVSSVLDATAQMGKAIQHGITQPAREVSGLLGGLKVGILTFVNGAAKRKAPVYKAPVGTYEPVVADKNPYAKRTGDIDL